MAVTVMAARAAAEQPRRANDERAGAKGSAAGGYVPVHVEALLAAWWSYAEARLITLRQLRVWLALHEMAARRRAAAAAAGDGGGRKPSFGVGELERLVGGVGGAHLRRDARRLEALGLAKVTKGKVSLLSSIDELLVGDEGKAAARALVSKVENHARRLPLPRRVLRYLAACGTRVLFATTLAHLLRCVYARAGELNARGRVKASWVADVFGVDVRGAERARAHLVGLGLLTAAEERTPREQAFERRWGKAILVNLEWEGPPAAVENPGTGLSGLPDGGAKNDTGLPVVESDQDPLQEEDNNQYPGAVPPRAPATGASSKAGEKKAQGRGDAQKPLPNPTLRHFLPEDLSDTGRLLTLHGLAAAAGLAPVGERGELEFVALAEHARCYATTNAPGMFAWLLKRGRFAFITQDDEEGARRRLTDARYGMSARRPPRDAWNDDTDGRGSEPANVGALLSSFMADFRAGQPCAGKMSHV